MRGQINGIWLTELNGRLHPGITPNLLNMNKHVLASDFEIVLWTNLAEISSQDLDQLREQKIIVNDHSLCRTSKFYEYFLFFLKKGVEGDITAFALASDILRMSILELTPPEQCYIYIDPNDIVLTNVEKDLSHLEEKLKQNQWGFSFYVDSLDGDEDYYEMRNDVLIALKSINPLFFRDYLKCYELHLKMNYKEYEKPESNEQAQELANEISMQTASCYFNNFDDPDLLITTFSNYQALTHSIHCESYLNYHRNMAHANTWLPEGLTFKNSEEKTAQPNLKANTEIVTLSANKQALFSTPSSQPNSLQTTEDERNLNKLTTPSGKPNSRLTKE